MKTCTGFAVFAILGAASGVLWANDTTVGDNILNGTTTSPNTTTDALTSDPSTSTSKTSVQPIKRHGEEGNERRHSSKSPNRKDSPTKIHVEERENSTRSSTTVPNQTANPKKSDNEEGDKGRRRSSIATPTSTVFTVSRVG